MEEELKCPYCSRIYDHPVLLPPCHHALCLRCAISLTEHTQKDVGGQLAEGGAEGGDKISVQGNKNNEIVQQHDLNGKNKNGMGTEASGADEEVQENEAPSEPIHDADQSQVLKCLECHTVVKMGPDGALGLPRYTAMVNIIARKRTNEPADAATSVDQGDSSIPYCQVCEEAPGSKATMECRQCRVLYCEVCIKMRHPARGPLADHVLSPVVTTKPDVEGETMLQQHEVCLAHGERPSIYCESCHWCGCEECASIHHQEHSLQPLDVLAKKQKTELSESLQQLSNRAKSAAVYKTSIKTVQDRVNLHCDLLDSEVERQCSELEQAIEEARTRLLEQLQQERDITNKTYREQTTSCTKRLQQTTALVQFCIQAIKEPEPDAFMQMGPQLIGRVSDLDLTWDKELTSTTTRMSPYIDLDLDHTNVLRGFNLFNFIKMKSALEGEERVPAAPGVPKFVVEDCLGENNSILVAWNPHPTSLVQGYVLEMKHGQSQFKEVYRGPELLYTVEELEFVNMYQLRVKAFNISGDSLFSDTISIRTSELAWFSFDQELSHHSCQLLQEGAGVSCDSIEPRTALAAVAFSHGRHFWQFIVDQYYHNTDVAFGVARRTVDKEVMLGNDALGWSMHINNARSCFIHGEAQHGRNHVGRVTMNSTVGVVLDMDHGTLQFYLNDESQGDIAFFNLEGSLHPAVSVNRNVRVTLHTSREPPNSDYDSQSDT